MEQLDEITSETFAFLQAKYSLNELIEIRREIGYHLKVTAAFRVIAEYREREEKKVKLKKLKTPIDELDLNIAIKSIFRDQKIINLAGIIAHSFVSILKMRGMDSHWINSIVSLVEQFGFEFDMADDPLVILALKGKIQEENISETLLSYVKNDFTESAMNKLLVELDDHIEKEKRLLSEEKELRLQKEKKEAEEKLQIQKKEEEAEFERQKIAKKKKILTSSVREFLYMACRIDRVKLLVAEKRMVDMLLLSETQFFELLGISPEWHRDSLLSTLSDNDLTFEMKPDNPWLVEANSLLGGPDATFSDFIAKYEEEKKEKRMLLALEEERINAMSSDERKIFFLMKPLKDILPQLSIVNYLASAGIKTFLDVVLYTGNLRDMKGVGAVTVNTIKEYLESKELDFTMSQKDPLIIEAKLRLKKI